MGVRSLTIPESEGKSQEELFPGLEERLLSMKNVSFELHRMDWLISDSYVRDVPRKEDIRSVSSTELVALCYQSMGLLREAVHPMMLLPTHFTISYGAMQISLEREATLARFVGVS